MEQLRRSFRLQPGSSSFRVGRSNSSLLISESVPMECARATDYERLSESMRLGNEYVLGKCKNKKKTAWGILTKALSFRKQPEQANEDNKKKKNVKRPSKWLPDPEKRWPVQGW